jgi:PAS domain S-box-containing protein
MAVARSSSNIVRLEERYREAVENAVEGVFRTTRDGRFVMANRALARMLGYDTPQQLIAERTDLAGQHYLVPEDRARFVRLLEVQGVVQGFEYEARRRDGSSIWLRDHARVVRDVDGIVYYEGTVHDVSVERRSTELLDLRARQQAAVARFGQAAIEQQDLALLFDCASSLIVETLGVEFSEILELRPDGDFVFRHGLGWNSKTLGSVIPGGARSQAGLTVASTQPIIMSDWGAELREHVGSHFREHGIVSGMTVIIGSPDRAYGVLGAHSSDPRAFTVDDVNFLRGIATILAAAIERRRADEVRAHLLARAISAQEEERTRVARELHDETGQALSAILLGLRTLQDAERLDDVRVLAERLRELTGQTIRDVGRIARGLRPSTLDDLGLVPALQRYAAELGESRGVDVVITDDGVGRLPTEIETTLYRIIQEALTNVGRHAMARHARVAIERLESEVRATIRDDGTGFNIGQTDRALGLVGMKERASLLGGRVEIGSQPGAGAVVSVTLPLRNGAH